MSRYTIPSQKREMFADVESSAELSQRYDDYVDALNKAVSDGFNGGVAVRTDPESGAQIVQKQLTLAEQQDKALAELAKSVSPEVLQSVRQQLASQGDIAKDLSLTNPVSSFPATNPAGFLVPFDLEAPAKLLVPRLTPLRNMIPRSKGYGTAHRFKRITGVTNSGTAGIANFHPGIADTTQTNFAVSGSANNLFYNRGAKITWAGDDKVLPYHQFGLSDEVPWSAQFSGQGFQDVRGLSAQGVLWASMLGEEKMMVGGRGTNTTLPYQGALPDPVANGGVVAVTARVAGAGEVGNSANIANLFIYVTAENIFGESIWTSGSVVTSAALAATTGRVLDVTLTKDVQGAHGYRVYVGTVNAQASLFLCTTTAADAAVKGYNNGRTGFSATTTGQGTSMFTINFTGGGTGGTVNTGANPNNLVATDTSAYVNGYDGILTYCDSPQSGYVARLNGKFSTSSPGIEYQNAFASLFQNVKAIPQDIWMAFADRKQLSEAIKQSSSTQGYRFTVTQDDISGVTLGDMVTTIINESAGGTVGFKMHPWFPQGCSAIVSYQLPWPDSNVSAIWQMVNVQDYAGFAWPVTQFSYDFSSYWYGSMMNQAPAFSGFIGGIQYA